MKTLNDSASSFVKNLNLNLLEAHKSWPFVKEVFLKLKSKGYKTFLVGGVVRDLLLHRPFEDFDLVTNASFEVLSKIFPEALEVGKSFGVFKLPSKNFSIEVSVFRKDGPYTDGRHPTYTLHGTQKEDAKRRDFTINALFYELETGKIIDHVRGLQDLESKVIRAIGSANKRFQEDHLRILRALRFASELNFDIERTTFLSVLELSSKIKSISKERIQKELEKLFLSPYRLKGIDLLAQSSLLEEFFPFYNLHKEQNQKALELWIQLKDFLCSLKRPSLPLILTSFFLSQIQFWKKDKSIDEENSLSLCIKSLKDLKFPSSIYQKTKRLLESQFALLSKISLFKKIQILDREGRENFEALWPFSIKNLNLKEKAKIQFEEEKNEVLKIYKTLSGKSKNLPSPWFKGENLKQMGWKEGKELGLLLEEVYRLQLEGEFKDRPQALKWLKKKKKKRETNSRH